jgi:hypothetical protein
VHCDLAADGGVVLSAGERVEGAAVLVRGEAGESLPRAPVVGGECRLTRVHLSCTILDAEQAYRDPGRRAEQCECAARQARASPPPCPAALLTRARRAASPPAVRLQLYIRGVNRRGTARTLFFLEHGFVDSAGQPCDCIGEPFLFALASHAMFPKLGKPRYPAEPTGARLPHARASSCAAMGSRALSPTGRARRAAQSTWSG